MLRKVLSLFVLLALSSTAIQAQAPVDQTFFLTFVPNVQFAPVYVALEKGHFAANGLNITIEHGDENVGVDLIAAGERQFGLISGEEVIKARANGRPVVMVYEWFQRYPVGIVTAADNGIESVADLAGKKVGVPGRFGASYNGLIAILTANGMTENDIQLEEIGFNAPDVFCLGAIDASVVYINNEPLQIQQRAAVGECGDVQDVTIFPVASAVDMVSNGLVTNEETIANNPELVQALVTAFDAGLRDAINNPAETYLLSAKYVENLPMSDSLKTALEIAANGQESFLQGDPSREAIADSRQALLDALSAQFDAGDLIQLRVLMNTIDLWDAEQLGYSDRFSWEVTQEVLTQMAFITEPINLDAAFTNDFILGAEG
ncbi:MAG: ABC transporter substrate-binding protein [Anaerolineae bacterium]|nr:ABC transporter substrate-binding protein [Anaerolineae bacterium]